MSTKLSDLNLKPWLARELQQRGYETAEDLARLTELEALRIPEMGLHDWRKICAALGR